MKTERLGAEKAGDITRAAAILRGGGTVAFPTETVYGLGANALDLGAVEKIFVAKQRPHWDPLIVHVADAEMLGRVVQMPLGATAERLIARFWPGPLTLLLPRVDGVPDAITAGRPLVGVRMPAHPVARALIAEAGVPIAAPSANTFGHTSPTTAEHVLADLDGRIDAVLDGGPTTVGVESTVAGVDEQGVVIYRAGAVDPRELSDLAVRSYVAEGGVRAPQSLPSPGVGMRHYAPRARLMLVGGTGAEAISRRRNPLELSLIDAIAAAPGDPQTVAVMLPDGWKCSGVEMAFPWGPWGDGEVLARRLFAGLRALDDAGASVILCPVPEMGGIGEAIRDRLEKAARPR